MNTSVRFVLALALGFLGTAAHADGFKCEGNDSTLNVKIFNHVRPELGTRTPAKLIVSDLRQGTLVTRSTDQIRKHNRVSTVQYVVDGNEQIGAETVILQVAFKAGREVIAAGEERDGQLILVDAEGDRTVYELTCKRYLKQD